MPGDYFSTRWTGRLTVPTTGSWQFFADVDDGLRLWVNGQLLLDKWNPPPAVYWGLASTSITLTAGTAYDFKVEYQDFYSDAYLNFRWAGPGTPQQGVPASAFSLPPSGPDLTPPGVTLSAPATATGPFTVTAAFSEPVSGLTAADFIVTNGAASALTGTGATYAVTITPAAVGALTVRLPAAVAADAASNQNLASNLLEITYSDTPPPPPSGPGLMAEYFTGDNFGAPALSRVESRLEFYWPESTSPGPGVPGDYFSTRWTGRLTVPTTGSWQFFADVDDGLRLWVNGQLLLDKWNPPPAVYWGLASTSITLTAGTAYDFKVEYQDFYSDAYLNFRWAGPGTPQQGVPASAFSLPPSGPDLTPPGVTLSAPATATGPFTVTAAFSEPVSGLTAADFIVTNGAASALTGTGATYAVTITPAAVGALTVRLPAAVAADAASNQNLASNLLEITYSDTPPPPPSGPGLMAEYFTGENFGSLALSRVESRLEFYWPESTSPGPGVPGDYFSTRWTGRLTVPTTGSWQFFADVDDGLRLWVNGQLLLDKWNPPPAVYWGLASTSIALTAGTAYDFKVEYQDFYSDAYLNFRWAGPGAPQQGVPASAFSLPPATAAALTSTSTTGELSGTSLAVDTSTGITSARLAAHADLPRLEQSLLVVPQSDGTLELQFTRLSNLRRATVLQASENMVLWIDIHDPGWPATPQLNGEERVRIPDAGRLLNDVPAPHSYFRLRAGP